MKIVIVKLRSAVSIKTSIDVPVEVLREVKVILNKYNEINSDLMNALNDLFESKDLQVNIGYIERVEKGSSFPKYTDVKLGRMVRFNYNEVDFTGEVVGLDLSTFEPSKDDGLFMIKCDEGSRKVTNSAFTGRIVYCSDVKFIWALREEIEVIADESVHSNS